jgi:Cof subfamily protein (haloacid dehalogenase superfamily)
MHAKEHAPTKTIHAIFLDVDGTYADYGVVPQAHERAVRAAREAGHKVLLCTGRPLAMLPEHILEAGFDGLVASAGAYVEVGGEVLMDRRFPAELAARTLAALDAHDAIYVLESPKTLQVRHEAEPRLREIIEAHFSPRPDGRKTGSSAVLGSLVPIPPDPSFAKISVFEARVSVGSIADEIGEDVAVVENSIADEGRHTGELFRRGISKADGVAVAIERLGIGRADTIAFGDGENDLEMVAYAGIGVAIQGSHPGLVALADRTALPPARDGIAAAFAELGLI